MIHAHHFNECAASMWSVFQNESLPEEGRIYAALMAETIESAERFYLPPDFAILQEGTPYSRIMDVVKLPFPAIALLKTVTEFKRVEHFMTVAWSGIALNDLISKYPIERLSPSGAKDFFMVEASNQNGHDWSFFPVLGRCRFDENSEGPLAGAQRLGDLRWTKEVAFERSKVMTERIANLCVMLSLHNVSSEQAHPSAKLNSKRISRGKTPLYSYKILKVDGQLWDGPLQNGDGTHEFRSHMRRGHVRRLDETRRVWVRSTLVHGKRPGFVDKEYALTSPPTKSD